MIVEYIRHRIEDGPKGAYLNFIDCADESRLHEVDPEPTYRRLVEVKRRYDPTNVFRRNLNVAPIEIRHARAFDADRDGKLPPGLPDR